MPACNLEDEARQLRDMIYGEPISNESWETIRKNWMREDSIVWLREHGALGFAYSHPPKPLDNKT